MPFSIKMNLIEHNFMSLPYEKKDIGKGKIVEICEFGESRDGYRYCVRFKPNETFGPNSHNEADEVLEIILGKGRIILGDTETEYLPGDIYNIPNHTLHGIITNDDYTVLISTQSKKILAPDSGKIDIINSI